MKFFRRAKTESKAQEQQDEYVVEVQDNNPVYFGGLAKMDDMPDENPTFDSEAAEDQVDPFGIEMDVQTYHKQTQDDAQQDNAPQEKISICSRRPIRALLIGAALMIALIIVLSVSLSLTSRNNAAATGASATPTSTALTPDQALDYILQSLNLTTPEEISAVSNVDTPQGQAVSSLAVGEQVATTRTTPFRIQQRYALAVFYFSTTESKSSSEQWIDSDGWNTLAPEECQWTGNTCSSTATTDQGESAITDLVLCKF